GGSLCALKSTSWTIATGALNRYPELIQSLSHFLILAWPPEQSGGLFTSRRSSAAPPFGGHAKFTLRSIAGCASNRYPPIAAQQSFLTVKPPGNGRLRFLALAAPPLGSRAAMESA